MQKWEYLRVDLTFDVTGIKTLSENGVLLFDRHGKNAYGKPLNLAEHFAKLGTEGWELVSAFSWAQGWSEACYLKRPIE